MGSTLEFEDFDKTTTEFGTSTGTGIRKPVALYRSLAAYPIEKQWIFLRPSSVDGIPYIRNHQQLEKLYLNTGGISETV